MLDLTTFWLIAVLFYVLEPLVSFFPQPHSCNLLLLSRALPSCFLLRISDGKPTCKVSVEDSSLVYECSGEEHKTFTVSPGNESKFADFATTSWHVTPICLIFRVQCVSSYANNTVYAMTRATVLRIPVISLIGYAMNVPMLNNVKIPMILSI